MKALRLPVGSRRVGVNGGVPVIYLGKDYSWLIGKKVLVEVIIIDENIDVNEIVDNFLEDMRRRLEARKVRKRQPVILGFAENRRDEK